jgi:hypothetical protein
MAIFVKFPGKGIQVSLCNSNFFQFPKIHKKLHPHNSRLSLWLPIRLHFVEKLDCSQYCKPVAKMGATYPYFYKPRVAPPFSGMQRLSISLQTSLHFTDRYDYDRSCDMVACSKKETATFFQLVFPFNEERGASDLLLMKSQTRNRTYNEVSQI